MKLAKSGEQYPLTLDYTAFHPGYLLFRECLSGIPKTAIKIKTRYFQHKK
ncbi:hypothetical protein [Candidatus Venteria ishoeyi]|nr:hypothetical protein [Candidatus Venteria ishoeyi]